MYDQPPVGSPQWRDLSVQLLPHERHEAYLKNIYSLLLDSLMVHPRGQSSVWICTCQLDAFCHSGQ